jgi:opacity protein-like surface antigen
VDRRFSRGQACLQEKTMKKILTSAMVAALAMSFVTSADAAQNQNVSADVQAACKAQAAKKFSAIHFLKRRDFVNNCIAQHASAKPKATTGQAAKSQPMTTGQAPNSSTTSQAPKQSQ